MRVKCAAIGVLLLVSAACGGAEPGPSPDDNTASSTSSSTTTSTPASSSLAPSSTTTAPPATAAPDAAPEPEAIPRLESGLPATFVAVTEGWEAVEVDTATGDVIRSIGQAQTPVEAEDEAMVSSAVQQVWRSSDHDWYAVSECCEPAAGYIALLAPGEEYREDRTGARSTFGWTVGPSPFDGRLATAGYFVEVGSVGEEPAVVVDVSQDTNLVSGVIAWDRSGMSIAWVANRWSQEGGAILERLDLDDPDSGPSRVELAWVGAGQWIDGIGTQESGNYVAFLHTEDSNFESPSIIATEGVVFDAAGELIATFPVETGSTWGGYDPSGKLLIYTDGDNVARWQGLGQSGVLGEGFIHASW